MTKKRNAVIIPVHVAVLQHQNLLEGVTVHVNEEDMHKSVEQHTRLPFEEYLKYLDADDGQIQNEILGKYPNASYNDIDDTRTETVDLELPNAVILPCEIGQWLYHIAGGRYRCIGFRFLFEKPFERDGWVVEIETEDKLRQSAFMFDDIGKKLFLTKEEAAKEKFTADSENK